MDNARCVLCGLFVLIAVATGNAADSINQKVVTFLKSKVGTRVGGGECAQAVSEALRVSGGAFAEADLGADNPDAGDYVWGRLVKILSYEDGELKDSDRPAKVLPGDVLQYHESRFESAIKTEQGTRTKTILATHHTSVAAKIDDANAYPIEVYEQNAVSDHLDGDGRLVKLNSIDMSDLRAGWVRIYRPKARIDKPGRYQLSLVNNTAEPQEVKFKFDGSEVFKISLTEADTGGSYALPLLTSTLTLKKFTMVLSNGTTAVINNANGYEIYAAPDGAAALRKLAN